MNADGMCGEPEPGSVLRMRVDNGAVRAMCILYRAGRCKKATGTTTTVAMSAMTIATITAANYL